MFGFPAGDTSRVLEEFQRGSFIAESRSSTSNSLFLRFHRHEDVERALAKNGTYLNGSFIGVCRCAPEEVGMEGGAEPRELASESMDTR